MSKYLQDILDAKSGSLVAQENFAAIEERLYYLKPNDAAIIGPPVSGAWARDELWIDALRSLWLCDTAGTPGGWKQIVPAVQASFPEGAPAGYEIIRPDMERRRFRYSGAEWVRINRHRHVQVSAATEWIVTHHFGFDPSAITIKIGGRRWETNIVFLDNNTLKAVFDTAQSGELICE